MAKFSLPFKKKTPGAAVPNGAAGAAAAAPAMSEAVAGGESAAGRIVRYAKDYIQLIIIIVIIFVIYLVLFVAFPRINGFSKRQNMDRFLQENRFLGKNLEGFLAAEMPIIWDHVYGNRVIFDLQSQLKEKVNSEYGNNQDPNTAALMEYYIFYGKDGSDMTDKGGEPKPVMCNGVNTTIRYPRFYRKYYAYKQSIGEFPQALGDSQKYCECENENKDDKITTRIKTTGDIIKSVAEEVKGITEVFMKNNILGFLLLPDMVSAPDIIRDLQSFNDETKMKEIYSPDFAYTNLHEYSWILFEALIDASPSFPSYDTKMNPLLINYLNSDFNRRQLARNVLIKNDGLCNFLDRYPIYSRIMLSDVSDKQNVYGMVKSIYKKSMMGYKENPSSALDELEKNIKGLKTFMINVSVLDLYLNTYQKEHKKYNRDTIGGIYASKYMGWTDFFLYLWKPYWEDFILNKVLMYYYRIFTKTYWEYLFMTKFYGWWTNVGNTIMNIPTNMAERIKNKRNLDKKGGSKEKFMVEGFLGKIFGPIIAVGKFFTSLLKVVTIFVKLITSFVSDPIGVLIDIFTLIIGTIFAIILVIIYFFFSIPGINFIVFIAYFIIVEVTKFIIFTIVYILLFALVTVVIILLTILNIISGNNLKNLALCQNSPGAWYRTPNYHRMNKFERSLMCAKPCPRGYTADPVTGFLCVKLPRGIPNYCPQAEIMRIYSGRNRRDRKFAYPDYNTKGNMNYESKLPSQREKILLRHFKKGEEFFETCTKPMEHYDNVPRTICENLDVIKAERPDGLSDNHIRKLEKVCRQAYCNSRRGGPYSVCSSLRGFTADDISTLIKNICLIIFAIIMFVMIIIIIVYAAIGGANADQMFK